MGADVIQRFARQKTEGVLNRLQNRDHGARLAPVLGDDAIDDGQIDRGAGGMAMAGGRGAAHGVAPMQNKVL
ncbi:MAG: hypothetical protein BWZ10_02069 [candidate division BRC1 bacterium ADurb.BinA364]|nr:MAG: hypothetical protein BWZ10_02069 [candidate division BRC1 bacterium ADurb.BinA364]